jgi:hypothetical protein
MWFELAIERHGWASLYLGVDGGSRGCTQTLRLTLSDVYDPLPDLATLAEHAWRRDLPCSFELESEGPVSRVSLRAIPGQDTALFEVRDVIAPAVYLAAEVDPARLGIALAHALRTAIEHPGNADNWNAWYGDDVSGRPPHTAHFGNAWLRDLVIADHPAGPWYFKGIETYNATRHGDPEGEV